MAVPDKSSIELFTFIGEKFALFPTTMDDGTKVWLKTYSIVEECIEGRNFDGIPICQTVFRAYIPNVSKPLKVLRRLYGKHIDA